jgi:hypothetical protein
LLSLLNDSSSAPATVPVAKMGSDGVGDHAKVDVLWISLSFMMDETVRINTDLRLDVSYVKPALNTIP